MQTETRTTHGTPATRESEHTLDSLASMSYEDLGPLYAKGTVPASIEALDGHPEGRMLAMRASGGGPLFEMVRRIAGARYFPWGGKSFRATSTQRGTGVNRLMLPGLGRHMLFPFEVSVGPSAVDGHDCILLNYEVSDNPRLIRHIHDELREVSAGVFLGPAMWKATGGHQTLVWFALDTNRQARAPLFA